MKFSSSYEPNQFEPDIYAAWEAAGVFQPATPTVPVDDDGNGIDDRFEASKRDAYSIVMPPPNANGNLHIGHGLTIALEDSLTRFYRLNGKSTWYIPGADHAGFETWVVYERELEKQGHTRFEYDRDTLYARVWDFVEMQRGNMELQLRALGASCSWKDLTFTLDENVIDRVYTTFEKMWNDGMVYRGEKLVNFCPKHQTAFADIEVEHKDEKGTLWEIEYRITDSKVSEAGISKHSADADSQNYNGHESESETGNFGEDSTDRCNFDDREPSTLRNTISDSYTTLNQGEDWICREINQCLADVASDMANYRFSEAVETLYSTIWDKYAGWFLESQKIFRNIPLLKTTLESLLIALHPFAPFVTEAIWQNLSWTDGFIISQKWPCELIYDPISASEFESLIAVVSEVRGTLQALPGVNNAKKYDLLYDNDSLVEDNLLLIQTLTKVPAITPLNGAPRGLRLALANRELYLDVPEKVVKDYKDALTDKILSVGKELDALNARMLNPNYVDKAPAHLVKETRDAITEKEQLISRLRTQLELI